MTKSTRARYTLEFKEEAVRLVAGGERVATVAKNLGLSEQTLHNWVKAAGKGGLKSSAKPIVSAEQMEISRLRSELSRVKMERDILKKRRRTSPGNICEVRLHRTASSRLACINSMLCLGCQRQRIPAILASEENARQRRGTSE